MKTIRSFIALGSNLNEPLVQLSRALVEIGKIESTRLVQISPRYGNPAIGPGQQPDYVNGVAELQTTLSARSLLQKLQSIELMQGRERDVRWAARTLDLDILLYGNECIELPDLQIPHPRMHQRNFVLYPLYDIAPDLILPSGTSLRTLLDCCPNTGLRRLSE